jgi:uncharacterized protein
MRRAEREISDPAQIQEILAMSPVLFLALHDAPAPYVVPLCFGCADQTLYVHGAATGTKLALLAANPSVGFSASTEMIVVPGKAACSFTCRAQSVLGTGRARVVTDEAERRRALDLIMRHYAPQAAPFSYAPGAFARTTVIAIDIEAVRGKRFG